MSIEYFSVNRYPGDGVTTVWDISFAGGYIDREHVKAFILDASGVQTDIPITDSMFVTPFRIDLGVAAPVGGEAVLFRDTPKDVPLVDFQKRSRLTEGNLDKVAQQAVFGVAEIHDAATAAGVVVAEVVTAGTAAALARDAARAAEAGAVAARNAAQAAQVGADSARLMAENARDAAANRLATINGVIGDATAAAVSAATAQSAWSAAAAANSASAAAGSASTATTAANSASASANTAQAHAQAASAAAWASDQSAQYAHGSAVAAAASAQQAAASVGATTRLQTARTLTVGNTGKAFDGSADVSWSLDEIGAARTAIIPYGVDLDTVVAGGFYRINADHANAPPGVAWGQIIVARGGGSNTILQIATGYNNGEIYWRQGNPQSIGSWGSWGPWRRFWHDGNIHAALNAPGSAPIYACRAWVNFNGVGRPTIRASGNVSSITKHRAGDYTINFTTAMPDANYSVVGLISLWDSLAAQLAIYPRNPPPTSNAVRISTAEGDGTFYDPEYVSVAIFR